MLHPVGSRLNGRYRLIISIVIFALLSLQFLASFQVPCLVGEILPVNAVRACDPSLWPFLSYPMYSRPHYLGEQLDRPQLYAILEDKSEVLIRHRELGFTITQYIQFHQSLQKTVNKEQVLAIGEQYERNTGRQVIGFLLVNHPTVFMGDSFVPADPVKLKTVWIELEEGEE